MENQWKTNNYKLMGFIDSMIQQQLAISLTFPSAFDCRNWLVMTFMIYVGMSMLNLSTHVDSPSTIGTST